MFTGIAGGNGDGNFRPFDQITLVEAAKMISKAYGTAPLPSLNLQPNVPWYEPYWYALARDKALPGTYQRKQQLLTRGDAAEIFHALRDRKPYQGFVYRSDRVMPVMDTQTQSPEVSQKFMGATVPSPAKAISNALEVYRRDSNSNSALIEANTIATSPWLRQSLKDPKFVRKYRQELRILGLLE
jgi:hypothetical protein